MVRRYDLPPTGDMAQLTCSAILFDLDGVLVDSTPAVARVWTWWAKRHGLDPAQVVHEAHGRPSISTIRQFLPDADHERENAEVERAELDDVADIVALPGARELLQSIPQDRWTIVTSGTRPLAEARLRTAGLCVPQHIVTASDVTDGKPHPEPYLKGAALLGIPASSCVVIEDVAAGVVSGKAAGAKVIAVRTTVGEEELRAAGAAYIANDCAAIRVAASANWLRVTLADA